MNKGRGGARAHLGRLVGDARLVVGDAGEEGERALRPQQRGISMMMMMIGWRDMGKASGPCAAVPRPRSE